ncbi:MAG: YtxH domain-containing protein [Bacilli bacterium]|nr:YtxH domain-containing protein [Bacilli bacterium]
MSKSGLGKFIIGACIGVGIGLLVASKPGKETREDIKKKFKELEDKFRELDMSDLKAGAVEKLDVLKEKIANLDSDQVADFTKEKIADIKNGLSDLTKSVKKKSVPVIKRIVDDISEKLDSMNESIEKEEV